jgi:hypothetical protein
MTETISVFGLDDPDDRGFLFHRDDVRYTRGEVAATELETRLRTFVDSMRGVLDVIPGALGAYQLDTVELKLEVSAKGTVSLLGSGGEVGGTGGITLTLKRRASEAHRPHQSSAASVPLDLSQ